MSNGSQFQSEISQKVRDFAKSKKNLDQAVVEDFIKTIHVCNGSKVCGFQYSVIKAKLSETDYLALCKLLGFDPVKNFDWIDSECKPGTGCVANIGHACDPVTCH